MKCKRMICHKEAAPGQAYCSRNCAPFGSLGGGGTRSEKTEKSNSRAPGGQSRASSIADEKPASESKSDMQTQLTERLSVSHAELTTTETSDENATDREESGTPFLPESDGPETSIEAASPESGRLAIRDTEKTQLLAFIAPSPNSSAASSASGNLIDSTLMHLHGLMKSLAQDAPSYQRGNPAMIQAVCNTAKQMRDLMKLKLEVAKEAKKLMNGSEQ